MILFLLIVRPPPRSNRTAPLVPSPTLVRSLFADSAAQPLLPRLVPRSSRLPSDDRDRSVHLRHRCACHRLVTVARRPARRRCGSHVKRSEEHTSELQSLMRISYAVFCLKKNKKPTTHTIYHCTNNIQK